ncbi:MAG: hypothetical protein ACOYOT_05025 [Bacteroidales bacterium]
MEIEEVSYSVYQNVLSQPTHLFGSAEFSELNRSKCESLHYLLFKDTKYRLGLVGGIRNGLFLSPFSAPFGGFSFVKSDVRIGYIDESLDLLLDWAKNKRLSGIRITLPPTIYDETFIAKQVNCLFRKGFEIQNIDLNYSFLVKKFHSEYLTEILWRNARKNLNASLKSNLTFEVAQSEEQKSEAYQIIKQNREARGFPLRMSWDAMWSTMQIVPHDCFLVVDGEQQNIASAMVFHVTPEVVQVIYWGDLPQYSALKTMNFLAYSLFGYYAKSDIKIIDIGPSTEDSIPNYGLCEFKEGLGCDVTSKLTMVFNLNR